MTTIPATTEDSLHIGMWAIRAGQNWGHRAFAVLDDKPITYAELAAWIEAAAHDLIEAGVGRDDRVVITALNSYEVVVYQLATLRIGATCVPVVPIYREHEWSAILADVQPQVVVAQHRVGPRDLTAELDQLLGSDPVTRIVIGPEPVAGWTPARAAAPDGPHVGLLAREPHDLDRPCLILYTSGTTSAPKGVQLSSRSLRYATGVWLDRMHIDEDDVAFAAAPLAHIAGLIPGALVPMLTGCSVVVMNGWRPDEAVQLIDRYHATFSAGAAVFLQDLVDRYRMLPDTVHRLSAFVSGGAATSPGLIRAADELGIRAQRAYGGSETAGVVTLGARDADVRLRAEFDGQVNDHAQMRIVDGFGVPLPPGREGSVQIRGAQVMTGYTDPQRNAEQFDGEWFDPGDLGTLTEDGWYRFTGRTKDIINRGGEKFSSRDIEEVIEGHPSVSRVAVTAVPDPRLGEAVGAFVVLEAGHAWPGNEAMNAFLRETGLAHQKMPSLWAVLRELPTTASGKIQKNRLGIQPIGDANA
jgi:acyl-CoA synthetase (AMP-forming)/AMP-acid ligase II